MTSKKNWQFIKNPGDGNCLFDSVAQGIHLRMFGALPTKKEMKKLSKELRKMVIEYQINHFNELKSMLAPSFLETINNNSNNNSSNSNNNENKQKKIDKKQEIKYAKLYIARMSRGCTWGTHIEAQILDMIVKELFNIQGLIFHQEHKLKKIPFMSGDLNKTKKLKPLHFILYGVNVGGYHFELMVKKTNVSLIF